jgi:predicted O-methyltransferase YrrM
MPPGLGVGWIVPSPLKYRQQLILGPSRKTLAPTLENLKSIDIYIHDGGHAYSNMMMEFETAYPYLRKGGVLISDDIVVHTAWPDFLKQHPNDPNFIVGNYGILIKT